MNTKIIRMTRMGRGYRVWLGCGCKFSVTLDEAHRGQLFIGKPFTCAECGEERA